jgi:hypothetical protein
MFDVCLPCQLKIVYSSDVGLYVCVCVCCVLHLVHKLFLSVFLNLIIHVCFLYMHAHVFFMHTHLFFTHTHVFTPRVVLTRMCACVFFAHAPWAPDWDVCVSLQLEHKLSLSMLRTMMPEHVVARLQRGEHDIVDE